MREFITYTSPTDTFLSQLLQWTRKQQRVCFLDSSRHPESSARSAFHSLIAVGAQRELTLEEAQGAFDRLKAFHAETDDWLFGYLSYDLKNDVEDLTSLNPDGVGMPALHFFQPEWVFLVSAEEVRLGYWTPLHGADDARALLEEIRQSEPMAEQASNQSLRIAPRLDRATYLERVRALQRHIRAGDIYEANFCQEFFATQAQLDPYGIYHQLNRHAPSPFSCFYRLNDHYLMCGSPERFLRKRGDRLISQPIKGTARRGKTRAEDRQLKAALQASTKDRSENVMIVDLVRNDLSRSAAPGSVTVEELFGIYSFPRVHQMISTVTSRLREGVHFLDALKYAFPMGSMTGAPKIRAMELIEQYESSKRGLYSGAVGYITPNHDFDFNVVIRSMLYNASREFLSFQVGGAIIDLSDPESEYEECLVKAAALFHVLGAELPENGQP